MNAQAHSQRETGIGAAEALYFPSAGSTLFGWLHRPGSHVRHDLGLIICSPFGYEATCAHRTIRVVAETASALGIPTLRFDYLGTGDAADLDPDADQMERWTNDVEAAVAELQRISGVANVVLLGIRLGAVMATRVAARSPAVKGLILIAPVVSGQKYLKELRRVRMGAAMSGALDAATAERQSASGNRDLDVSGFTLSAASVEQLAKVELGSIALPPQLRFLIVDGERMTEGRDLARQWGGEALADNSYQVLPGFDKMIMSPLRAVVPQAILQAVRDWLADSLKNLKATRFVMPLPSSELANFMPLPSGESGATITERPVFVAWNAALLFGIVTEPANGERRKRAVVLLNTGADYHIGANRMHVSLARRWAARGYIVLRVDLGGLGDSTTRAGSADDEVFPAQALADIAASIDFIKARYGVESMAVGGVCSGAYHALRAAVAGLPMSQILLINPQNYFWKEDDSLEDLQLVEVIRYPTAYLFRIFSMETWRRVFSGGVRFPRVLRIYYERLMLAIDSWIREAARRMKMPLPQDLGVELETIAARGVKISFVFAKDEPGAHLLYLQGGSTVRRLGDRCRVHILDVGDHIFSQRSHREIMETVVTDELLQANEPRSVN